MPRAKKTAGGKPGQPVQAFTGQEYGQGVVQENMQRAMPAPQETITSAPTQDAQNIPQPATGPTSQAPADFASLQKALAGVGGILNRPDERPDVAFNDSLSDPGVSMRLGLTSPINRTGEFMRELSRRTGDTTFADLAARAGL